jgi:short-subunit dehydrogenase
VEWRDQVAVVTGASSGIGRTTARAFAARGCRVVAVARREALLASLVEECRVASPESCYLAGDLGTRAFAEGVIDESVRRFGRIDVLVNNAAITKHKQVYHLAADEVERVLAVNFLSSVWTTLAAIPYMLRQGGGFVVNVSSVASRIVPPREAAYAASKAAMNAFTEGLWNDLHGSNVHAALIVPGAIDTEIWGKQDEPVAYRGGKVPPEVVTDAIIEAIERRRFEIQAPKRRLDLWTARWLRFLAPRLLRLGMRRMDPVPAEVVERARERARRGKRLGDLSEEPTGTPSGTVLRLSGYSDSRAREVKPDGPRGI